MVCEKLLIMGAPKSSGNVSIYRDKPKVKRKGIHSKCKSSKSKKSTNYKKVNRGQG